MFARFGVNHLHRGLDRGGVSTLGSFIAELAQFSGASSFHVATFAAGGEIRWAGFLVDADETKEELAFAFLASLARYPETVFDLRPIRQTLHKIPEDKRSPLEASLVYWSDSYDAIACYQFVTPLP